MKIKIMLLLVGLVNINLGAIELPDANSALKPPPTDLKPTVVGIPNRIGDGNNTTLPIDDKPPIQILPIDDSPPPPGGKVEDELAKNPFIDYKSEYEKSAVEISSLKEQVTELSNKLVQSEKDKTDSIADLNKKVKELESSLKNAKEESSRYFSSLQTSNNNNASLQATISDLELVVADLTHKVENPGLPFDGWVYSPELGWCFVSPLSMPYIYVNERGWAFYEAGTSPRKFFFYDKEQWELHE